VHGKYRATRSSNSPLDNSEFSFVNGFSVSTAEDAAGKGGREEEEERAAARKEKEFLHFAQVLSTNGENNVLFVPLG